MWMSSGARASGWREQASYHSQTLLPLHEPWVGARGAHMRAAVCRSAPYVVYVDTQLSAPDAVNNSRNAMHGVFQPAGGI
jgi:hypothetical protein